MTAKHSDDSSSGAGRGVRIVQGIRRRRVPDVPLESSVQMAIRKGFVVGREVLVGRIPGIVVGYNIGGFGRFVGAMYPLVIRTALGITKCSPDELELV
jgi:hypothetical protein